LSLNRRGIRAEGQAYLVVIFFDKKTREEFAYDFLTICDIIGYNQEELWIASAS
jgi:hypothetical protein